MADQSSETMASTQANEKSIAGIIGKRGLDGEEEDDVKRQKVSDDAVAAGNATKLPPKRICGIQLKLTSKPSNNKPLLKTSVFDGEEDEQPEEMPREARMRMRNIGRNTPTSAGPNSFGKTKQGFCNVKKVFENSLKSEAELACEDPNVKRK